MIKQIPNTNKRYGITENGQVWSYLSNRFLTPHRHKKDALYLSVSLTLSKGEHSKEFFVHDLVALTYIPNPENKSTVDHIDRNPLNNNKDNLRWATMSEQNQNKNTTAMSYSYEHGFIKFSAVTMCEKESHKPVMDFDSITGAARYLFPEADYTTIRTKVKGICRVLSGEKPSMYGYFWQYT